MNSRKMFFVMIVVSALLVGGLGLTLFYGNAYLKSQSQELLEAKLDRKSLNEQQSALIKAKKDLEKYQELYDITKTIVPQDKDQAKAVREIVRFADESGVKLKSIAFDDSTLGTSSTTPKTADDGNNGTGVQPNESKSPITQAEPVSGLEGVYSVPVTVISTDNVNQFDALVSFLSKLENNRRTAQVEKVNIVSGTIPGIGPYLNFTLTINIFVKP